MGIYRRLVAPRVVSWACAQRFLDEPRRRICAGLSGVVIEIGFGAGTNLPFYPDAVTRVIAVEPSSYANRRASQRERQYQLALEHLTSSAEEIPLADASCDAGLVTFSLCTIPNPESALHELLRVIKPGGTLHLLEHGLSPDPRVARWQRRLDPLEVLIADGCHLSRNPLELLESSGFVVRALDQRHLRGPRPWTYVTLAVAERPVID